MKEGKIKHLSEIHGSVTSYVKGFILSLVLTIAAYILVTSRTFENRLLMTILVVLAVSQVFVQLTYFLHMGQEKGPRWKLVFFLLTLVTVSTIFLGSLWIMYHLNHNMMPEQVEEYLIEDEGVTVPTKP